MLNHFRTLLMNLSYNDDPTEHIPVEYRALTLPSQLQSFYDILYPPGSSRFYILFLTHQYLQLIDSTLYRDVPAQPDPRISYSLDNADYFKFRRNSIPQLSDPAFPIFVYGNYINDIKAANLNDLILIRQLDSTTHVSVTSSTSPTRVYLDDCELLFSSDISQMVKIPTTNLSFQIAGTGFTGSGNKTWSFYTEDTLKFDFPGLYSQLISKPDPIEKMFSYNSNQAEAQYESMWRMHPSSVYRVTGLLIAYVERVNTLWVM